MTAPPPVRGAAGRATQARRRISRMEDYMWIGGDTLSTEQAAQRLGVTPRTIRRYRRALREAS